MKRFRNCIILVTSIFILTNVLYAGDWSKWRGPYGTGISNETHWNPSALDGMPKILWETNVGVGHSTPSVKGDRLYILGNKRVTAGSDTLNIDIVHCMDAITGREVWRYEYPCEDKNFPGPNSSPVIDGDVLYTLSWMGDLYCFDAATGRVRWKRHLVADSISVNNEWGFAGSPVVFGDMLLLTAGKSGAALNKHTGETLWKSELEACGLTTPVLFSENGRQLALFSSHPEIHAVDIETGERLWSYEWKTCNDPFVLGDKVFLTANHNRKRSMMLDIGSEERQTLWESRVMLGWSFQNLVVIDGHAYGIGNLRRGRLVQCIDLKTGELKWSHDHGGDGALIAAGERLIILENDGELVVAEATPEKYSEISRARVLQPKDSSGLSQDRHWHCWTLPVLAEGRIYARSTWGDLVCVDVR